MMQKYENKANKRKRTKNSLIINTNKCEKIWHRKTRGSQQRKREDHNKSYIITSIKKEKKLWIYHQSQWRRLSVDFFDESVFDDDKEVLSIGTPIVCWTISTIGLSVVLFTTAAVVGSSCVVGSEREENVVKALCFHWSRWSSCFWEFRSMSMFEVSQSIRLVMQRTCFKREARENDLLYFG